jgi:glycosyltransferase involved in cell wall biosynthesis
MVKVAMIISNIDQAWFFESIHRLIDKERLSLYFILLNPGDSELERTLLSKGVYCKRIEYKSKKDALRTVFQCRRLLKEIKPDMVHAHLLEAGLFGLSGGWLAGVKTRIYTRHGGSQRNFLKKGVLLDKICSFLSTHLIATCENVKNILTNYEKVADKKVTVINLGLDIDRFVHPDLQNVAALRQKYNAAGNGPVIGVISRWVEWKGIQYILPAFKQFLKSYPDALLVLANSHAGTYRQEILTLLDDIPKSNICLIGFEHNNFDLYHLFDIFVHVPVDKESEAFGQVYIEPLAAGIPSVFTLAGVAPEFIEHEKNALVVDFRNAEQIHQSVLLLWQNQKLREDLIVHGRASVQGRYRIEDHVARIQNFYLDRRKN